jgi:hypothetical protein
MAALDENPKTRQELLSIAERYEAILQKLVVSTKPPDGR